MIKRCTETHSYWSITWQRDRVDRHHLAKKIITVMTLTLNASPIGPSTIPRRGVKMVSRSLSTTGVLTELTTPTIWSRSWTCASTMGWMPGITWNRRRATWSSSSLIENLTAIQMRLKHAVVGGSDKHRERRSVNANLLFYYCLGEVDGRLWASPRCGASCSTSSHQHRPHWAACHRDSDPTWSANFTDNVPNHFTI